MFMSLDSHDISRDSLKILWYNGVHPSLKSRWISTYVYINVFICSFLIILAIKGVLDSYTNNIFFLSECLVTIIIMTHSIGKLIALHSHKSALKNMLEKKSHFWKIKNFDGEIYRECSSLSKFVKKIILFYYYLCFGAVICFDLQPFTSGYLPTGCYVPEGWYNILMVLEWYISYPVVLILSGTDGFFCSLATSLIIQFKLLNHKFKTMKLDKTKSEAQLWKELKELVNYHNFLLNYCEELNSTFKGVFLLQFVISIASASVSIFIFMQPGAWANRIKFLTYFGSVITETTFYCLPLDILVNAATQLSDAVFESQWYTVNLVQLKKCLTLIIARSQKSVVFSGYGMVYFNLRTFVIIWKTVFTFYTYLNSAKKMSE